MAMYERARRSTSRPAASDAGRAEAAPSLPRNIRHRRFAVICQEHVGHRATLTRRGQSLRQPSHPYHPHGRPASARSQGRSRTATAPLGAAVPAENRRGRRHTLPVSARVTTSPPAGPPHQAILFLSSLAADTCVSSGATRTSVNLAAIIGGRDVVSSAATRISGLAPRPGQNVAPQRRPWKLPTPDSEQRRTTHRAVHFGRDTQGSVVRPSFEPQEHRLLAASTGKRNAKARRADAPREVATRPLPVRQRIRALPFPHCAWRGSNPQPPVP